MNFRNEIEHLTNEINRITSNFDNNSISNAELSQEIIALSQEVNKFGVNLNSYHDEITAKLKNTDKKDNVQEIVNYNYYNGKHNDFQADLAALNERLNNRKKGPKRKTPEEIEEEIRKYKNHCDGMVEALNKIRASLVLDSSFDLKLNDLIISLDGELKELDAEAKNLIDDIDTFRENAFGQNPSMTVTEIRKMLADIKDRLKSIKTKQIEKYNSKVVAINKKISDLRGLTVSPEIAEMIAKLTELNICETTIRNYKDIRYLDSIDYNKLLEMNKLIDEIEKALGRESVPEKVDLDDDIKYIEDEIVRIDYYIKDTMSQDAKNMLMEDISKVATNINEFRIKLENNKDKLTPEEYNNFIARVEAAESDLYELNNKLSKVPTPDKENNIYKEFQHRLDILFKDLQNLEDLIDSLKGKIVEEALAVFETKLVVIENGLEDIKKEVEQAHNEGKLDDVQFNNLVTKMNEIEERINKSRGKLKDPEMIKDSDIFAFLNKDIDGLEHAIDNLEKQIDGLNKPIKNKNVRKQIEAIIVRLEEEIKLLRSYLEKHKDEDHDKYQATADRLNKLEDRLTNISKNYRKKCPLRVRAVKSAKDFYKKHKKAILIAAGLAAVALLAQPVIIPAIMHGNLMLMETMPAARGLLFGMNSVLSKMIGAKTVGGLLTLSSGVIINPTVAASSILKGIAFSGLGTATLVTPVIAAVKELVDKMRKKKLKENTEKQSIKQRVKKVREKGSEKLEQLKKKKNQYSNIKEQIEWYGKYKASGLTKEEFVKQNNLPKDYIKFFIQMENSDMADYVYSDNEEATVINNEGRGR